MPDTTKVSTGKAKTTGAVYKAPVGTTLPADATTALSATYVEQGYVSEDGLVNSNTRTVEPVKAWGGDVVANVKTDEKDVFKFKFLESLNANVLKDIYGDENVDVASVTGDISVTVKNAEVEAAVWVFEMILKTGNAKRIVIPNGSITSVGDIVYKDNELIGYEVEITAAVDSSGNTHYEYIEA